MKSYLRHSHKSGRQCCHFKKLKIQRGITLEPVIMFSKQIHFCVSLFKTFSSDIYNTYGFQKHYISVLVFSRPFQGYITSMVFSYNQKLKVIYDIIINRQTLLPFLKIQKGIPLEAVVLFKIHFCVSLFKTFPMIHETCRFQL